MDAADPAVFNNVASSAQRAEDVASLGRENWRVHLCSGQTQRTVYGNSCAAVIIVGAVRGVVRPCSMNGLGDVIEVHELGSGNSLVVQTRRDAMFRASPFVEPTVAPTPSQFGALEHVISSADLQKETPSACLPEKGSERHRTYGGYRVRFLRINALPAGTAAFWFIDPLKPAHADPELAAYRFIETESTLIVFPLISEVTTTAQEDFLPVFSAQFRPLWRFLRNRD